MFFASAFAKKFQLLNDDEFWRSEPHGYLLRLHGATIRESPAFKIPSGRKINVGLINRVMMDEIKMPVPRSRRFRVNDLGRGTIKIRFWKNGQKPCGMMSS